MKYTAVIVAAGMGSRLKLGYNKVFYTMKDGMTVLEKTVRCFDQHELCQQIVVVTQKENFNQCQFQCSKELILCEGGSTRSDSVINGLARVKQEYVLIHDGARPFVTQKSLDALCACLQENEACILAVPCKDTIKVVHQGVICDTPDRSTLYQAQTPQAFKTGLLQTCYQQAKQQNLMLTDDASCVEKISAVNVMIVEGDYANIKITTAEDLKEA